MSSINSNLPIASNSPSNLPKLLICNTPVSYFSSRLDHLEKKHQLVSPAELEFSEDNLTANRPTKKRRTDRNIRLSSEESYLKAPNCKEKGKPKLISLQSKNSYIEIVSSDEDEECVILDKPAEKLKQSHMSISNQSCLTSLSEQEHQKSLIPSMEPNEQNLSSFANMSLSDLLLIHLWNQIQPIIPQQELDQKRFDLRENIQNDIAQEISINDLDLKIIQNEEKSSGHKNEFLKQKEVILIEDDESTCGTSRDESEQNENQQISFKKQHKSNKNNKNIIDQPVLVFQKPSQQLVDLAQVFPIESNEKDKNLQSNQQLQEYKIIKVNTNSCAIVPKFQLNTKICHQKARRPKRIWNPHSLQSLSFDKYFNDIEKAVGMDITNQEKLIKTLKSFDGNIEVVLSKIKRNKAHYKNYFKVQKFERIPNPYS